MEKNEKDWPPLRPGVQPPTPNLRARFQPNTPYNLVAGSSISDRIAPAAETFTPPPAQHHFGSSSGSTSFGSRSWPPLMSPGGEVFAPPPAFRASGNYRAALMSPPVRLEEQSLVIDDIRVKKVRPEKAIKTKICRAWAESGYCRYNSNCWFAHGEEELYQYMKSKSENEAGSSSHGKEELYQHMKGKSKNEAGSSSHGKEELYQHMKGKSKNEAGSSSHGKEELYQHMKSKSENEAGSSSHGKEELYQHMMIKSENEAGSSSHGPNNRIDDHLQHAAAEYQGGIRSRSQPASPEPEGWSPLFDSIEALPPDSDILPSRDQVNAYISTFF